MHTHMSTIMAVKALPRFFLARSRAFMSKYHTSAMSVPVAPARNGVNQGSAAVLPSELQIHLRNRSAGNDVYWGSGSYEGEDTP